VERTTGLEPVISGMATRCRAVGLRTRKKLLGRTFQLVSMRRIAHVEQPAAEPAAVVEREGIEPSWRWARLVYRQPWDHPAVRSMKRPSITVRGNRAAPAHGADYFTPRAPVKALLAESAITSGYGGQVADTQRLHDWAASPAR
jgi:hypothetical protein